MPKDRERLKPDTATKNFVERDDVFRDFLCLAYPRHKIEGLTLLPNRMISERERDVAKGGVVSKNGKTLVAMLLIEC